MNILSCFDGMSCAQIALNRLGIKYDNYFSSEIDEYAIKVTQHNYPNTIQIGDITKWQKWNLPKIDLIVGGSPCQGFSFAGKQLNFDDPRSKLFFEFEKIVKCFNPQYWLLENVVMKQDYQDIISQRLGIKPIMINSALVSAQSRKRLYWTNIGNKLDLFEFPYCNIQQPENKRIVLADIIENSFVDKTKPLIPNNIKVQIVQDTSEKQKSNKCLSIGRRKSKGNFNQITIVYSIKGKSPTLTTSQGGNTKPKISINNLFWRKLTPLECERLQTVPDNYTLVLDENGKQLVSNTQRYKMLGNGMTIDVICHILQYIMGKSIF